MSKNTQKNVDTSCEKELSKFSNDMYQHDNVFWKKQI